MAKKGDQQVKDLYAKFGGANFADILNRLWMMGKDPKELQKAIAETANGTNDPTDIIARLINKGVANPDEITKSATLPVPQGVQWAFGPENVQNGVVKAWHTNMWVPPPGAPPGTPGLPTAAQAPLPNVNLPNAPAIAPPGTGSGGGKTVKNVTSPPPEKPKKKPTTPEEIAAYQKEHFGSMLWVSQIPELAGKMKEAAQGEWTAERFKAEVEGTKWWQETEKDVREWWSLKGDPATYQAVLKDKTDLVNVTMANMGFNLDPADVQKLADDAIKFKWEPDMIRRQAINLAKFDPNIGGVLGANMGAVKNDARNFFVTVSDQEAFKMAQQMAGGEVDPAFAVGQMRARAKASYPGLAEMIDQGVIPRDAMSNQIQTVATLMDMDPDQVDFTTPEWNSVISHADNNGKLRPMNLDETSRFVKQKDDYWKTSSANKEVSDMLTSVGRMFGRTAY